VWFAEPLLSSATEEVQRVIALARQWAERLAKPVGVWMSDKQDAFVQAIGTEFPHTPHRYCQNHFLRDVAKPVLELDSQAKVKMRRKVRGLRTIERRVLAARRRPRPVHGTIWARARPPMPVAHWLGRCRGPWTSRTRRERSCWGIAPRCEGFLTTTRVVRFTRRVYE
jgi:hypothetical protein